MAAGDPPQTEEIQVVTTDATAQPQTKHPPAFPAIDVEAANIKFRGILRSPFEPLPVDNSDRSPGVRFGGSIHRAEEEQTVEKDAPEKKITLFALRLAILEKSASNLGTVAFIWATVVLLGGLAVALKPIDFWIVTGILLVESTRIFSRCHELEWQHEVSLKKFDFRAELGRLKTKVSGSVLSAIGSGSRSAAKVNSSSFAGPTPEKKRKKSIRKRTWSHSSVRLIPYTGWLFIAANTSILLFWIQIVLGVTCVILSLFRLAAQSFGRGDGMNLSSALNVFYAISLAEALFFLTEKAYWHWKIFQQNLFFVVSNDLGFDSQEWGAHAVRAFFYEAYGRAVNGSIFDALKLDFVSFGVDLLMQSNADSHTHLTGARILRALAMNPEFVQDTLRSIGTMRDVVDRLIEILSWKNLEEEQIRLAAAETVLQLVSSDRNCVRVSAVEGSLECISSLLYRQRKQQSNSSEKQGSYNYHGFTVLGLKVLNNLARYHENCSRIGATRGLLPKIVDGVRGDAFVEEATETAELSLRLLTRLASSTGSTGEKLRKDMLEIVDTISNIRDLIVHCSDSFQLQILSIDTLSSLSLDPYGRICIGATGGVISNILKIFFRDASSGGHTDRLIAKGGEALALLALETEHNCRIIKSIQGGIFMRRLIGSLEDPKRGISSARILRSVCCFCEVNDACLDRLKEKADRILRLVLSTEGIYQEAVIGLAAQVLKTMRNKEIREALKKAGTSKDKVMRLMRGILQEHRRPNKVVPDMRRFCVELIRSLVESEKDWIIEWDVRAAMMRDLEDVMETTSEMENFNTFSGSVGLNRHPEQLRDLVASTLSLFD